MMMSSAYLLFVLLLLLWAFVSIRDEDDGPDRNQGNRYV